MCGIVGILHLDGRPAEPLLVRRMSAAIAHRGPDGEGAFVDGPVGLGHRRLAIIDPSPAGHQPMQTADGRYVLTYNGEVYNFNELRAELEACGHAFHSRTDSEVVLKAWAEWGHGALSRFNGMFAFAIWDRKRQVLFLARDRYGQKPLYYTRVGNSVLFGSEIKALLAYPGCRGQMDPQALLEYMTFQNFFSSATLFKSVELLPAGHWMRVSRDGTIETERFWDFDFGEPAEPLEAEEYLEELERLFVQAVGRQLISDVPVNSYLSGGMDSGSITAIAARQIPNLKTFTVGFDLHSASGIEMAFDERDQAEHMSYLFGTEHYEMVLKAGDMERAMRKLVFHLEEPRVGQSYPNFYAAKLASRFGKVVMSGAGGDELFGGYPWRYYRAVINDDFEHYIDKYYSFWQRLVPNSTLRDVFSKLSDDVRGVWTRDIFRNVFKTHANQLTRPEDYINHSLYFEAKTFLHGLLIVEDKLSMAHGLEARLPFLDNDLVDFAQRVPVRLKLGNLGEVLRLNENLPGRKTQQFFEQTRDGKLLLRQAMRSFMPPAVLSAKKQGFSAPDSSWFRGESIDYVRRKLLSPSAKIYDFLERKAVTGLINEHLEGRENRRLLVWALLYLEEWCGIFLSETPADHRGME